VYVTDKTGKDVTGIIKCINGWHVTISAFTQTWAVLHQFHNFEFLLTRRLSQDPLENFFQ